MIVSVELAMSSAHRLNWAGFQTVMNVILPIVTEEKLKFLIEYKTGKSQTYSLITVLLNSYLEDGFMGMVKYYTKESESPLSKDEAIRKVAESVYNVFKYYLVKYLGIFDMFYRYRVSLLQNKPMEDVPGLGLLLQRLEYNALSPTARRLSDFGVPFKVVSYYDDENKFKNKSFDKYEDYIDQNIQSLLD